MAQAFYSMLKAPKNGFPSFLDGSNFSSGEMLRIGTKQNRLSIPGPTKFSWRWASLLNTGLEFNKSQMEILVKFNRENIATTDSEFGFGIFLNAPNSVTGGVILLSDCPTSAASGAGRRIRLRDQSSESDLYTGTFLPVVSGSETIYDTLHKYMFLRLSVNSGQARFKAWWDGTAEPSSWSGSGAYTVASDRIKAGIIAPVYGGSANVEFISIGTDGDSAPLTYPGGNRIISGTLLKPDNSPAEGYIVRCYLRENGELLGEAITNAIGSFSFSLPIGQSDKVSCVGVDQLGNTWNAPIKDLIAPVSP
ncbi:MAG: hypothetical protein L0G96_16385 [Acinetobacter sp.]|nr:hypothetical protein [Acinetobacter sp.]